jgi:hypothetical protein
MFYSRLTIHDCFTDHLGWRNGSGPAPLHEATPTSFITSMGEATTPDCPVIIDSLSTLLQFHPTSHVCHLLHQIGEWGKRDTVVYIPPNKDPRNEGQHRNLQ